MVVSPEVLSPGRKAIGFGSRELLYFRQTRAACIQGGTALACCAGCIEHFFGVDRMTSQTCSTTNGRAISRSMQRWRLLAISTLVLLVLAALATQAEAQTRG